MSDRLTPLPWRGSPTSLGAIVADDPTPDESPLGRADASAIAYYGGVLVAESMRTADRDYAVRAVNEYAALLDIEEAAADHITNAIDASTDVTVEGRHRLIDSLARLDAIRVAT